MLIIWATMIAVTAAAPDKSGEKLITANNSHGKNSSNSICKTPVCVQEASTILGKIDLCVNPCDNFYKFACGKFLDETVIPKNMFRVNTLSSIDQKINDQILISLSDAIKKDDLPVFQYMKSFYQTCIDTEKIAKNTGAELKEVVMRLGGWPILYGSSWSGTNFDWQKFVIESGRMGFDTHFYTNVYVDYDLHDSSKYIIQIDYPVMEIFSRVLMYNVYNPTLYDAYVKYMKKVASILGGNFEEAEEDMIKVRNFERKLREISYSVSKEYRTTVSELEQKYPKISWIKYINGIIASNTQIGRNEEVLIKSPDFLDKFYALITVTPNRVLANYGMWSIIQQSFEHTKGPLHDAFAEFVKEWLYGKLPQTPRRDVCVNFIKKYFSTALESLYVRLHFDEMAKTKVTTLVGDIRATLHYMIEQANWMDSNTKGHALDKLNSISENIGYPDELINDEKLTDYYNLKVHPESFLKTYLSLAKFDREKIFSYIMTPGNESKWIDRREAYIPNAFYEPERNLMDIRAAILQEEFFNATRPNYLNYGAIGWTIGHEMTHAFDNDGSKYDKNGVLADWWQPETKVKYSEKVKCFIKQYSNYTVKEVDMTINGQQTVLENVADNDGWKTAYHAYNKWAQKNGPEPQLPGLDYTPQQMFWISAASSHCDKIEKEHLKSLVRDQGYSPSEFRIIGSFSNYPEFSKYFHCPPKSPMNPENKCTIW